MGTLQHERLLTGRVTAPARDPHVFAATNGRRAGVLRTVGIAAGLLALAWLAALALALAGAGSLPGLLPRAAAGSAQHGSSQRLQPQSQHRGVQAPVRRQVLAAPVARTTRTERRHARSAVVSRARPAQAARVTPATAPPAAQASRGQGWARRGWTAPPGQTRQDQAPAGHGNGKQQAGGTTTPPGQSGSHSPNKG